MNSICQIFLICILFAGFAHSQLFYNRPPAFFDQLYRYGNQVSTVDETIIKMKWFVFPRAKSRTKKEVIETLLETADTGIKSGQI